MKFTVSEKPNCVKEHREYEQALKRFREAREKFFTKQKECFFAHQDDAIKESNKKISDALSTLIQPQTDQLYQDIVKDKKIDDLFRRYDEEDAKIINICRTIVNDPIHKRDGVTGLAQLSVKVINIVDPNVSIRFNGVSDHSAHFTIARPGPFGERIKDYVVNVEGFRL